MRVVTWMTWFTSSGRRLLRWSTTGARRWLGADYSAFLGWLPGRALSPGEPRRSTIV